MSAVTSGARAAVQLEPAQLEEMQRTARLVLAHPLVTDVWPRPGALGQVRRWQPILTNELRRVCGFRLDVGPTSARLYRRSATVSPHRPATLRSGRRLGRWAGTYLCLVLAALEGSGSQVTVSGLADDVLRLAAGDDALPLDLTSYEHRRAFVDAVRWLEERGVVRLRDGAIEQWLAADDDAGDALYDVDSDVVSRLLVASPSVLRDVGAVVDFLADRYPPTAEGDATRVRHRLARRLLEGPVVFYDDLDDDEVAYVRQRRSRLVTDVERLTGCAVEARAEGLVLVDAATESLSSTAFPGNGTVAHAALLLLGDLVAGREAGALSGGRWLVSAETVHRTWAALVGQHRSRFRAEYRADTDRLRSDALALAASLGLAVEMASGDVEVRAAAARYRPAVTVADGDQLSLLGDPGSDGDG